MLTILAIYLGISILGLIIMVAMIIKIADMIGPCPKTGASARVIAAPIAASYASIGLGGILILAALLPIAGEFGQLSSLAALGLVAVCLGLGFTQAVTALKAILLDQQSAMAAALDASK